MCEVGRPTDNTSLFARILLCNIILDHIYLFSAEREGVDECFMMYFECIEYLIFYGEVDTSSLPVKGLTSDDVGLLSVESALGLDKSTWQAFQKVNEIRKGKENNLHGCLESICGDPYAKIIADFVCGGSYVFEFDESAYDEHGDYLPENEEEDEEKEN